MARLDARTLLLRELVRGFFVLSLNLELIFASQSYQTAVNAASRVCVPPGSSPQHSAKPPFFHIGRGTKINYARLSIHRRNECNRQKPSQYQNMLVFVWSFSCSDIACETPTFIHVGEALPAIRGFSFSGLTHSHHLEARHGHVSGFPPRTNSSSHIHHAPMLSASPAPFSMPYVSDTHMTRREILLLFPDVVPA